MSLAAVLSYTSERPEEASGLVLNAESGEQLRVRRTLPSSTSARWVVCFPLSPSETSDSRRAQLR
jgi:hypothetical protein